jgi:hypothetical protein
MAGHAARHRAADLHLRPRHRRGDGRAPASPDRTAERHVRERRDQHEGRRLRRVPPVPAAGDSHRAVRRGRLHARHRDVRGDRHLGGGLLAPPPPPEVTVFADDFETDQGWVVNPLGTDAATSGRWERGDPQSTNSSGPKQLGASASGVNNLVTGRLAGSSSGSHDVDGGRTSVRSPQIDLPAAGTPTLTFRYYMAHGSNSSSADYLRVQVVTASGSTTVFQEVGAGNDDDAAWATATVNLAAFAGQAIRIHVEAADASGASLVEAAVDDVKIVSK